MLVLGIPLFVSCQGPADYDAVKSACGSALSAWEPSSSAADIVDELDETCAATLGRSLGMNWDSFEASPSDLEASTTGAYLLAGVATMLGHDASSYEDLAEHPTLPEIARIHLEGLRQSGDFGESASAAEAWFAFLQEHVSEVRWNGGDPSLTGGGMAAYYADEELLIVSSMLDGWKPLDETDPPALVGLVLAHEASHAFTSRHDDCGIRQCDASPEGSYGIGVWWLADWMQTYSEELDAEACAALDGHLSGQCNHITDGEEWPPCATEICP